jgi:hypothetical protein
MERNKPGPWFTLGAALISAAALAATTAIALANTHRTASTRLFVCVGALAFVGFAALVAGISLLLWPPKVRFRAHALQVNETVEVALERSDGRQINRARCRITRRSGMSRVSPASQFASARPSFRYPNDFESLDIDGALSPGRYSVLWDIQRLDRSSGRNTWVRVAKTGLRVTEAIHEEAENLRRSGTFTATHEGCADGQFSLTLHRYDQALGWTQCEVRRRIPGQDLEKPYFVELEPPRDATDTEALFPSQFHRRVGETRIIGPDGAVGDEPTYEPAQSAPGDYEVLWKSVSYATGGVFDSDHEITMDDFRRERQRAQDRFTIPADSGANG